MGWKLKNEFKLIKDRYDNSIICMGVFDNNMCLKYGREVRV